MKTKFEGIVYEPPQIRVIEVEVEKGFALSGNVENPIESNESPW